MTRNADRWLLAVVGACASALMTPSTVVAQAYGGAGGYQQGGYGQAGYGQAGFGGGYGQQSGYGSGAFGGGQGGFGGGFGGMAGGGGFGAGGMNSFGGGMGAQGGAFGQTSMMGGGMAGSGMFGGGVQQQGGRAGQRNFIGRDATEVQAGFQNQFGAPQQGGQFFADMVQNFNDLREQRRRWRDRQNAPPPVRVQLRPAFDLPARGMNAEIATGLQTRVNQMLATRGVGSAQVESTEQGVVLTGSVASDHDRRLIAVLASLEPGVARVDNRLTVATQEASSPEATAPVAAPTAPQDSQ